MKILIVDDDFVSRTKMRTILENFGECEAVDNGTQAIQLFSEELSQNKPFDLMTLDIDMPEIDGKQVLQRIRGIEAEKDIEKSHRTKVIMVTSYSDKENIVSCIQAGCNDYVIKPFSLSTVSSKLQAIGLLESDT